MKSNCWCERDIVDITADEVKAGVTRSCGRFRCTAFITDNDRYVMALDERREARKRRERARERREKASSMLARMTRYGVMDVADTMEILLGRGLTVEEFSSIVKERVPLGPSRASSARRATRSDSSRVG